MKPLIKNFIEVKENDIVTGLRIDLKKATILELNIYTAYMKGRLSADEVMSPFPNIKVIDNKIMAIGTMFQDVWVEDFIGDLSAYSALANLFSIATISSENGYVSRIMDVENDTIIEKKGFEDCVGRGNIYTMAGVKAFIQYREKQSPEKFSSLLKSLKDSGQKLDIIYS